MQYSIAGGQHSDAVQYSFLRTRPMLRAQVSPNTSSVLPPAALLSGAQFLNFWAIVKRTRGFALSEIRLRKF